MKISLNWVFDHIKGELAEKDIAQLVNKFIKTTAEIEGWKKVSFNVDDFTLVRIVNISSDMIIVHSDEYNKDYNLIVRGAVVVGAWYLIKDINNYSSWATAVDLGGTKDMLLPELDIAQTLRAGGWKCSIEVNDYIIDVDNKSITNRPDLWSHRGLAREIAAILDLSLKPLDQFIVSKQIVEYERSSNADDDIPFPIAIDSELCKKFSALYINSVVAKSSAIDMVIRLSRLDSRAIDLLVDATNYVMFDLGQPMHAFDAESLSNKNITIAQAQNKERLSLLDGQIIELTSQDLVIADGGIAVSLAGIMGGAATAVTSKTRSLLLESAAFEPTGIRRTASSHKKVTESSKRFEKSLDSYQITDALLRFLFILEKECVDYTVRGTIKLIGKNVLPTTITVEHQFIQSYLGVEIASEKVIFILEKLYFDVTVSHKEAAIIYTIGVPSFRATKDVKISQDIVEEIGRYIGYDSLPRVMPSLQLRPSDLHTTYCTRKIKRLLSYGLCMRELYGYSFFDETVLSSLAWEPKKCVEIKNPISENYTRLVTTLQPHLLKAVSDNSIHHTQLRFYEWGRVWHMENDIIVEQKSLSGIFFDRSLISSEGHIGGIDFYSGKALLQRLFDQLHIDVSWRPGDSELPWYMPYQVAVLTHEDVRIGSAGMIEQSVVNSLTPTQGAAFIFELNVDYLLDYKRPLVHFNPLSKYPSVRRDVSILIGVSVTIDELIALIQRIDQRIESVELIDFFTKPEWVDQKAMTFHVEMCDKEQTLSSDDIEMIWAAVIGQLCERGAVIR